MNRSARRRPGRSRDLAEAMARYRAAEEDFRKVAHLPGTVDFRESRSRLEKALSKALNYPAAGLTVLFDKATLALRYLQFADLPRSAQNALVSAILDMKKGQAGDG